MRLTWGVCLLAAACGGDGGTGPTTSHQIAGEWTYETRSLQDGLGTWCATTGTTLRYNQAGVTFSGSILAGSITCIHGSDTTGGHLGVGQVQNGVIHGDSIEFYVDGNTWRSFGTFITPDSVAGTVNAIFVVQGQQYILVGNWYSKRK